ncbi:MAG: thiosulfate oxidation carrier complex protein SoxZ [Gammaproteobacteria bacterium]|nr:MAG: thiosulfate oxidation carrier complex protein SoxZ [Gammaproteobacteria bacterium]
MARAVRFRTREQAGKIEIFISVKHPMDTGLAKDKKTKKTIPAHYIQKLTIEHKGKLVADVDMGIGVSANPQIGIRLESAKNGDTLKVSWKDNKGESGSAVSKVDL